MSHESLLPADHYRLSASALKSYRSQRQPLLKRRLSQISLGNGFGNRQVGVGPVQLHQLCLITPFNLTMSNQIKMMRIQFGIINRQMNLAKIILFDGGWRGLASNFNLIIEFFS